MNRDLGIGAPLILPTGPQDYAEKRRHPRRQLPVRCWMSDGAQTLYARVHDISLGGLSLRSPVPFLPDAQLDLALIVPGSDGGDHGGSVIIRARGRLVWVRAPATPVRAPLGRDAIASGGPRMGAELVQFLEGETLFHRLVQP